MDHARQSLVSYIYSSASLVNTYMLIARMPMEAAGRLRLCDVIGLLAWMYLCLEQALTEYNSQHCSLDFPWLEYFYSH